ncbi:hypothetical protein HYT24_02780 [Candidatus Pacearchaeota archaeon]|nr:hypothetical protein [Candidatus Pacearchaeota archaeon]
MILEKTQFQYLVLFTIVVSLFSLQQILPVIYLKYYYWIISFAIILFGLLMVTLNINEAISERNGLKKSFSKWLSFVIYVFSSLVGFIVVALGIYFLLVLAGLINAPII